MGKWQVLIHLHPEIRLQIVRVAAHHIPKFRLDIPKIFVFDFGS
jgi:hypothetical protein